MISLFSQGAQQVKSRKEEKEIQFQKKKKIFFPQKNVEEKILIKSILIH